MTIIKAFTNVFFTRTEGKYYFCESFALCVSVFNLVYLSFFLFFINVNEDAFKKKTRKTVRTTSRFFVLARQVHSEYSVREANDLD